MTQQKQPQNKGLTVGNNSVLDAIIGRFSHEFIQRTTKSDNAELFVCTRCGATKNILNADSKCIERPKPFGIERFLNAL